MATQTAVTVRIPNHAALPDNSQYKNRFEIQSESSDSIYVIAQHKTSNWWACSCRGWIAHRHCKHLSALGLPGHNIPYEPKIER